MSCCHDAECYITYDADMTTINNISASLKAVLRASKLCSLMKYRTQLVELQFAGISVSGILVKINTNKNTPSVTIFQIVDQCCINRLHLHVYGGLDYKLLVADRKRSMIYYHLSQSKLLKLTRFI